MAAAVIFLDGEPSDNCFSGSVCPVFGVLWESARIPRRPVVEDQCVIWGDPGERGRVWDGIEICVDMWK